MVTSYNKPLAVDAPIKTIDDYWARSEEDKANAFGMHLRQIFTENESVNKEC